MRLQQAQAVDIQLEGQLQEFRRPAAEEHPLQKDLEVVHHGAEFGVDAQGEGEGAPLRVQCQLGALGGIVDPVMDVEALMLLVAHPARRTSVLSARISAAATGLTGKAVGSS